MKTRDIGVNVNTTTSLLVINVVTAANNTKSNKPTYGAVLIFFNDT